LLFAPFHTLSIPREDIFPANNGRAEPLLCPNIRAAVFADGHQTPPCRKNN
jgi:hypothetical protein